MPKDDPTNFTDLPPLPLPPPIPLSTLQRVLLPSSPQPHDISISSTGHITSITPSPNPPPSHPSSPSPHASLLALPSLCHPHIHLDKAHLLTDPLTSSLSPKTGSFSEALTLTSSAKELYTPSSLLARMNTLLSDSLRHGVTSLRAFCEVDTTVGLLCVRAGLAAKTLWASRLTVQICAFAQDPLFSGTEGEGNRGLMERALELEGVDVLGVTPYVEADVEGEQRCVEWAVRLSLERGVGLDFHLDYYLDAGRGSRVWDVLEALKRWGWAKRGGERGRGGVRKTVCLGHCTRFTRFNAEEWEKLGREVRGLPIYFVGLPTSDLFMMGRPEEGEELRDRGRGTLQVLGMVERGFACALGVNNVGNAFTPFGSGDPLEVGRWGVGIYQAGTGEKAEMLFECVSGKAREAIGLGEEGQGKSGLLKVGNKADLVLIGKPEGKGGPFYRRRRTVKKVVWDAGSDRITIFEGKQVDVDN
ncbi:MAG: hypothetical protein MMC23_001195 [Stictis urceolatum]|nr:hypothetical protein [Stictis urceolata]